MKLGLKTEDATLHQLKDKKSSIKDSTCRPVVPLCMLHLEIIACYWEKNNDNNQSSEHQQKESLHVTRAEVTLMKVPLM